MQELFSRADFTLEKGSQPDFSFVDLKRVRETKGIVFLVGSSGSGKSSLGKLIYDKQLPEFVGNNEPINSHCDDFLATRLQYLGLHSFPAWVTPTKFLSTGEKYRVGLAKNLVADMFIDEFTSCLDRLCAFSVAKGLRKVCSKECLSIAIATCHRDIEQYLRPDLVVDLDSETLYSSKYKEKTVGVGEGCDIYLEYRKVEKKAWIKYAKHHYLTSSLPAVVRCHEFFFSGIPVAIVVTMQCIGKKGKRRESRLVVKPHAQGLGIGLVTSEHVAKMECSQGYRYYTKTKHPALGIKRNKSAKWKATQDNMKIIKKFGHSKGNKYSSYDETNAFFCHEFIP